MLRRQLCARRQGLGILAIAVGPEIATNLLIEVRSVDTSEVEDGSIGVSGRACGINGGDPKRWDGCMLPQMLHEALHEL